MIKESGLRPTYKFKSNERFIGFERLRIYRNIEEFLPTPWICIENYIEYEKYTFSHSSHFNKSQEKKHMLCMLAHVLQGHC